MVSVRAGYGRGDTVLVGTAGTCLAGRPASLPGIRSESAYLSAPARRSNPSYLARSVGAGPAAGTPGRPVRSPRDQLGPAWNLCWRLCARCPASPQTVPQRGGRAETVLTPTPELVWGRSCGVWHPEPLISPHRHLFFPPSFPNVGGAGCQIHVPVPQPSSSWGWQKIKIKIKIPKCPGPSPRSQMRFPSDSLRHYPLFVIGGASETVPVFYFFIRFSHSHEDMCCCCCCFWSEYFT